MKTMLVSLRCGITRHLQQVLLMVWSNMKQDPDNASITPKKWEFVGIGTNENKD